jgi:hypothetical protein
VRIGITGASGKIGRQLVQTLRMHHQVISFGREDSDIEWAMGVMPSQLQLKEVDVLIHLAWSLKDRRNDFHLNVGGTGSLSFAAKRSGVPFLFISSVAASSISNYGLAKAEAEKLVIENDGQIVRVGLIPKVNRYSKFSTKLIGVYPNLPKCIRITPYKTFEEFILEWVSKENNNSVSQKYILLSSEKWGPKKVFSGTSRVMLPLPYTLIRFVIYLARNFSLRARNLEDALNSLITITSETK